MEPIADKVLLKGKMWPIKIKGRYLLQPGKYQLQAIKSGYYPLQEEVNVTSSQSQSLTFVLKKKPGYLTISTQPKTDAEIIINNKSYGTTPLDGLELEAGAYALQAAAENFLSFSTEVIIEGKGKKQNLNIQLIPNWAEVTINSKPIDAEVWINGKQEGHTPLVLDLISGEYDLEIRHQDFIPFASNFVVKANEPLNLPLAELFTNPSQIVITSTPPKAIVSLAGLEKGITPLTIQLNPNMHHTLTLTKAGFKETHILFC